MSNYIVEDDLRDYNPKMKSPSKNNKKRTDSSKYLVVGVAILIVMIFVIIIASRIRVRDEYSSIEIEMVNKAEKYVLDNNISDVKEIYLDINKLDITIPNNCNLMSGVIYQSGDYKPYLLCDDYESNYLKEDDDIKLNGNNVVLLAKGSNYYELGYIGEDVTVSGKVNINEEGIYNIYYIANTGKKYTIRKVIVVDNPNVYNLLPIINLDSNETTIEIGQEYQEKVMAIDKTDGNITNDLIKVNNINNNEVGEYKNYYSITNRLGYTTMAYKNVIVVGSLDDSETSILTFLSNDNMTNDNIIISVRIIGSLYDHTVLPDNSITKEREFIYEVSENDDYLFDVYNVDGSKTSKIIIVDNIDRSIPVGSCEATLYNDRTVISVNMTSFNYIVGYNYIVDGKESGYLSNNYYTSNFIGNNDVSVKVKDYINNENIFKCTLKNNKFNTNGYQDKTYIDVKPRLHKPIGEALANKGYTISDLNRCIYNRVLEAGPGTRYGVAAAAYGLIDCTYKMTGYVLPYNHTSGKVEGENYCSFNKDICGKLGVNSRWGSSGGSCASDTCWHGLNCATFVRWAMCNGGMDLCSRGSAGAQGMTSTKYFPEADGVYINAGKVTYYSGRNLTNYTADEIVRMIKPGDAIATGEGEGHTFVVVGLDNNGIYTAEDGYYMRYITYSSIVRNTVNYRILLLDNYYANPNNKNHLYG